MTSIKSTTISSLIWKFLERGGTQGISFVFQVIMARLLTPHDYGQLSLLLIFILLANVFIQTGFSSSLIQKKEIDLDDYSSVFIISLLIAIILYIVIYLASPEIANFYNMLELSNPLRVLSISLLFGSLLSIQTAYIVRNYLFKLHFFVSMIAIVISGTVGILLALNGYGIWALVAQYVLNQFILMIIFIIVLKLKLAIKVSLKKAQVLLSFGWKLLVSSLIDTVYNDIRSLLIGKIYSSEALGFYNRGKQFPELIANNFNGTIQTVMFPILSRHQEDTLAVKNMMRKSISLSAYILFPLMFGLFIIAEPLVLLLLTDKWIESVIFIQIFAISYSLWPIHVANLQAMNSLGRSDLYLKLEIIKKSIGFILLFISVPFGIIYIALSMLLGSIISSFINAQPNKKLLDYGYIDQIKDILPAFLVSFSMIVLIYPIKYILSSNLLLLAVQISTGVIVFVAISKIFKIKEFNYILNTFKEFLSDRRR